jgi:hypothetical protein
MMIENLIERGPRQKVREPVVCAATVQVLPKPVIRQKLIDRYRRD